MKLSVNELKQWKTKSVTLLGMSGVGKTRLAAMLRRLHWFHYSGDYRIGTRYMGEAIVDNVKQQAMQVPFLRALLRADAIQIHNNIGFENLSPLSTFLGKLGNPELGGLSLPEFKRRQRLHHVAEVGAMLDVPGFIRKAREIYAYDHFVNDVGGSLCELDDPRVMEVLAEHTLILYIRATEKEHAELVRRAEADPKPLYYREDFLDQQLAEYMAERNIGYVALIEPDDFVRWVFPRLYQARTPRYEAIAEQHGYTISSEELHQVRDEADFFALLETAVGRAG